jgi:hypothetical protein
MRTPTSYSRSVEAASLASRSEQSPGSRSIIMKTWRAPVKSHAVTPRIQTSCRRGQGLIASRVEKLNPAGPDWKESDRPNAMNIPKIIHRIQLETQTAAADLEQERRLNPSWECRLCQAQLPEGLICQEQLDFLLHNSKLKYPLWKRKYRPGGGRRRRSPEHAAPSGPRQGGALGG